MWPVKKKLLTVQVSNGLVANASNPVARLIKEVRNSLVNPQLFGEIVGLGEQSCCKGDVEIFNTLVDCKAHDLVESGVERHKRCRR